MYFSMIVWSCFLAGYYFPIFGGDPEIHIIFSNNLLNGNWLQFNREIYSGGETSPVYMLLISLFSLFFDSYQQYFLKALSACALFGIIILIAVAAGKERISNGLFVGILYTCMCFVPFQTALGMENILFAFLILLFIYFFSPLSKTWNNFSAVLIMVPFLFYLRPEAIFLLIYISIISLIFKNYKIFASSIFAFVLIIAIFFSLDYATGVNAQSAGVIRAFTSRAEAYKIVFLEYSLYINIKPLRQLIYVLPIFIYLFFKIKTLKVQGRILILCFFIFPFFAHLFSLLPNTHYSRYSLYSYAVLFYVFSGVLLLSFNHKIITVISIYIMSFSFVEFYVRMDLPRFTVFQSVENFKKSSINSYSNELYERLSTSEGKISIALQEVQLRGRLDDRFIIWSLDGITDASLSTFVSNGYIDHFDYIKYRKIDYLQGPLFNYNSNKILPSIADYKFDSLGNSQCIKGIAIHDIGFNNFYRIKTCK